MKLRSLRPIESSTCVIAIAFGVIAHTPALADSLPVGKVIEMRDLNSVDLLTGLLSLTEPPISIGEPDQGGISFHRKFAGAAANDFGYEWNTNYNYYVSTNILSPQFTYLGSKYITTVNLGERAAQFTQTAVPPAGGPYFPVRQDGTSLVCTTATYCTFTDRDGTVVNFTTTTSTTSVASPATLTQVIKPNGEIQTFTYSQTNTSPALPVLQDVSTNFGYQLHFSMNPAIVTNAYNGFSGTATLINNSIDYCSPSATSCAALTKTWPAESYSQPTASISNPAFLETDTDATLNTRTYNFQDLVGLPQGTNTLIARPGAPGTNPINYTFNPETTYAGANPPVTSLSNDSGTWMYSSAPNQNVSVTNFGITFTGVGVAIRTDPNSKTVQATMPNGISTTYGLISLPEPLSYTDELVRTTQFFYDIYQRLTYVVEPEGTVTNSVPTAGYTQNVYDTRGNVTQVIKAPKAGSGLSNLAYNATYPPTCTNPKTCNQPTAVFDAKGNETDYTYDPNSGGMLSEMSPPMPGGARPLTVKTYAQRSAWVKNAAGSLVQSPNPIWLPATTTTCQTAAGNNTPTCDPSATQTTTTYLYGASGAGQSLLVKGKSTSSGTTTLVTCYGYDIYNRKISETTPNAGLATCP